LERSSIHQTILEGVISDNPIFIYAVYFEAKDQATQKEKPQTEPKNMFANERKKKY